MSKIDKLQILGVRSFDNQRAETIAFHTPLTLIVGHNGSGKTTIIESLKYATTGELPPNSRGGAFIHDPNLCGEKEVLAQVKLSFKSVDGTKMVCTRNLQLTVKKANRTMKTLEGSLLMMKNGDKRTLSSTVAELNTIMPQSFGASKAILNNVVFCHQDEALWPLAPPLDLKRKFDEIFEAQKYTKAIDNIKVMQKNYKYELAGLKKSEEHAKEDKDRALRDKKRMDQLGGEIDALSAEHDLIQQKMQRAVEKLEAAYEKVQATSEIVGKLEGKRIERATKEESVESLRQNLEEMDESDEALKDMLEKYEERVGQYEQDLQAQKLHYQNLTGEIQNGRVAISAKERDVGSYEAEERTYNSNLEQREELIKETARSHNIRGFDLDIDDSQVRKFMDKVAAMAKDQNTAFEQARREISDELREAQRAINQINEKKSNLNQRKDIARQNANRNDGKIGDKQAELNRINADEGALTRMTASRDDIQTRLANAKSENDSASYDSRIQTAETELRTLEEQREKLDEELNDATMHAGATARLDYAQKEKIGQESALQSMKGAHEVRIAGIVGQGWSTETLEKDYLRAVDHAREKVAEAERQRDGTSREMEQLDFKLKACRSDLKSKQAALKKAADGVLAAANCDPEDYPATLLDLENHRNQLKEDADSFKVILEYLDNALKQAEHQNGGCMTCKRSFKNEGERRRMIESVQKERKKFELDEKTPQELEQYNQEVERARGAGTDFDTWERLREKEIPALERDEKALAAKREKLVDQLEQQDGVVSEHKSAEHNVGGIKATVTSIVKYVSDIQAHDTNIKELLAKQKSQGLSRGVESIREEVRKVSEQAKEVKTRVSKLTSERDRARTQLYNLEFEIRDIRSKLQTAETELREKKKLEEEIEEHKQYATEQREMVRSIDQDLQGLGPELSQTTVKYDDIARRGDEKTSELQAQKDKLNTSINKLNLASHQIKTYLDQGGPQQLKQGKQEAETLRAQVTDLERRQSEIVRQVKELESGLQNHADTKRGISDNQRFRRDLRALQNVHAEIEELEQHNAEEDKDFYSREGSKWQQERNKLSADKATVFGSMKTKSDHLTELMQHYDADYAHAGHKYKEAHILVETRKACIDDLGRYCGALDKAIMRYHSEKMEAINRIIEDLWRKTYQGTDVDTILIRSENETAGKGNKSYNYRVCMVKQDAEMDMRGRCSAGQKVLASIIIRLALADCFGVECGLVALDEPTTNLDRDNIRALAESLAEIIRVRRQQRNFQLIIITHDEEFLQYMGCSDFADHYYRVGRNDRQKSEITRQKIKEVMG